MHHGYAQAEGVANLDKVPATGAWSTSATRSSAAASAATRASWPSARRAASTAVKIGQVPEAPLRKYSSPLHWDTAKGMRVR